ncbi:MAG: T9SS type A sorting domain-containing protein [Urechidicola sp.]|nr:T9SS type A sorting domain-containing protein [Urechidicola sp.]
MKKITLLLLLITTSISLGQNLATNGDFESLNPFDATVHTQATDDPSNLSIAYIENFYHKRDKSNKLGLIEELNTAFTHGTRSAKVETLQGRHIRYGVKSILNSTIIYTVKLDFYMTAGSTYNKAFNINAYQAGNGNLGSIGSSYKPTVAGWTTWSGEFQYGNTTTYPDYDSNEDQYINISVAGGTHLDTYIDNLQILILACLEETISVEAGGTSAISIYANDVNNGVAVDLTNESLTSHTFYEADGTTNANAKFTLETDGTITAMGGVAETDYKITYRVTSDSDADTSGTNDWDEITQTFSVAPAPTYLPEKTDFTFETPADLEGWVENANVGAPTTVGPTSGVSGAMTITFPDTHPVDDGSKTVLDQTLNSVNPQENDFVYIRYKNNSHNDTFRFQITNNEDGNQGYVRDTLTAVNPFKTMTAGFEVLQIDLSAQPKWADFANADSFQMLFRDEAAQVLRSLTSDLTSPGTIIIDRILFTSDPSAILSTERIEIEDVNLTLSPNPVNDMLTIRSSSNIEKVEIYNLLGQKVLTDNSDRINVSTLSKGIYVSKVYLENDSISSKKFIKQ